MVGTDRSAAYHSDDTEMKNRNTGERGFAMLAALAIIAVLVVGGGAYYASRHSANVDANANADANTDANADANAGAGNPRSLRALFGLGQNVSCSFSKDDGGASYSGTVFVAANGRVRGDFTSRVNGAAEIGSHMVKDGDYAYVWTDATPGQGVKIAASAQPGNGEANGHAGVDLDEAADYRCSAWSLDEAKFSLPAGVSFIDVSNFGAANAAANAGASANANANLGVGAGANVGASGSAGAGAAAGQCASCDSLPATAQAQCRAALGC